MEEIGKSRKNQILIKIIHLWSSDIQIKNQGARDIEARKKKVQNLERNDSYFPQFPFLGLCLTKAPSLHLFNLLYH